MTHEITGELYCENDKLHNMQFVCICKSGASKSSKRTAESKSKIKIKDFQNFKVIVLPALLDNYMYLIIDKNTNEAAVVDPVVPSIVWNAVRKEKVNLTTVLTTHHHWDHASGNRELIDSNTNGKLTVVGGNTQIYGITVFVKTPKMAFQLGSLKINCIRTPCHTTDHICYYVRDGYESAVFTGDTLFVAGCGKFIEGTPLHMYNALIKTLSELPDETYMFCGHEFALRNLKFASYIEPDNEYVHNKLNEIKIRRQRKEPSVPSTIGTEKLINPFMRVQYKRVQSATKTIGCPIETMRILRQLRDNF